MSLRKNVFWSFMTNSGLLVLSFLVNIPLTRILGPEYKGIFSYLFLVPGLVITFSILGLDAATMFYTANKKFPQRTINSHALIYSSLLMLFSTIGLVVFVFLTKDKILANYFYLLMVILFIIISFANRFLSSTVHGFNLIKQINVSTLMQGVLNIVFLLVIMLFAKTNFYLVIAASVLVYLPSVIYLYFSLPEKRLGAFSLDYLKASFRYGSVSYTGQLGAYLNQNIGLFIIAKLLDMSQLGIYTLAVGLAEKFLLVVNASGQALLPHNLSKGGDYENTAKICRLNIFIGLIFSLTMIFFIRSLIVFLYSARFAAATVPLLFILPGIVLYAVPSMISTDLAARGRYAIAAYVPLVAGIANIVLNLTLIPMLGLLGAAISSTTSYALMGLLMFFFYKREVPQAKINEIFFVKIDDIKELYEMLKDKILAVVKKLKDRHV